MKPELLDCRELPCPQPVIRLRALLQERHPADVDVIVDNEPAVENVSRLLANNGYAAGNVKEGDVWRVSGHSDNPGMKAAEAGAAAVACGSAEEMRTLVMIVSPVLGQGDDGLGGRLMKNFLLTLPEMGASLWRIVMLNGGVTLAAEGSPVLEQLQALERGGTSILVCGTCLEHFGLTDRKKVGETTNMLDIVTSMSLAHKVIRL